MDIDTNPPPDPREQAYAQVIALALLREFRWGSHDCVTFAAECVEARTGRNPMAGLEWPDASTAARMLRQIGGLRAAVTSRLGEPGAPGYARTGDVALCTDPNDATGREMLAVCHGGVLLAPSAKGLAVLPLAAARCAWRVGDA